MTDRANYTTPPISRSPSYAAELEQIPVRPPRPARVLSEPILFMNAFPPLDDLTDMTPSLHYAEIIAPSSPAYATQPIDSAPPSPIVTPQRGSTAVSPVRRPLSPACVPRPAQISPLSPQSKSQHTLAYIRSGSGSIPL